MYKSKKNLSIKDFLVINHEFFLRRYNDKKTAIELIIRSENLELIIQSIL